MGTLLAHEWLAKTGGSENVFEVLTALFPYARKVCLWNDAPGRFGFDVEETWLARTPLRRSKSLSLPFFPCAWNHVDITSVDRIVVSSHAFAHHLAGRAARNGIPSFAYIHTPARYIWTPDLDERGQHLHARAVASLLKQMDRAATDSAVRYAANSRFVKNRIENVWDRGATVIYPPVDVDRLQEQESWPDTVQDHGELAVMAGLPHRFVLAASRLIPYKRIDVAFRVGEQLDLPVVVAGSGPDERRLKSLADACSVPVQFIVAPSSSLLYSLFQRSSLFVFMAIEDFGIMPVEAMALGTPVLVNTIGGAKESVELLRGGIACPPDSADLKLAAETAMRLDMRDAVLRARMFSKAAFAEKVDSWVNRDGADRHE